MKFFIALVLALAVCGFASAQSTPGDWTPIQYDPHNATLTNLYQMGREFAQVQAILSGEDPNGDWIYFQVNSLQVQVANGMNYQFNVAIFQGLRGPATLIFIINDSPLHLVSWQVTPN